MKRLFLALMLGLLPALALGQGSTGSVIIAWDPDPATTVVGYKVYYGTQSGVYTYTMDVGFETEATLPNLQEDVPYYCVVTAYNALGVESGYSEELMITYNSENPGGSVFKISKLSVGANQMITFEVAGMIGNAAEVYASEDLVRWTWVGTYSLNSGTITINDPGSNGAKKRFYKLALPPSSS
jgi:hypothetical protein